MGLDMYLNKKIYIGAEFNDVEGKIEITRNGKPIPINFKKVSYITEEAVYWRKANQIHKWFVDNVQEGVDDCGHYYVSKENLEALLKTINDLFEEVKPYIDLSSVDFNEMKNDDFDGVIAKNIENINAICDKYLPTQRGFFFGGVKYDFWYFFDLNFTKKELEKLLEDNEENKVGSLEYHASW